MEKLAQVLSCFRNITPNKTHTVLKQNYYSTKSSSGKRLCNLLVSFIKRIEVQILLSPLIVTIKLLKKKKSKLPILNHKERNKKCSSYQL